jgi:1,4-dihydroxy-2-naphthoyl-CoA hydrolase
MTQEEIEQAAPYVRTLGARFTQLEPEETVAELPGDVTLSTLGGGMHGGVTMALADMTATVCAFLNAPQGALTTTADSTSHFLRPLSGPARATARPLRAGRRTIVIEVDVADDQGRLCVRTIQSQAILDGR